MAFNGTLIAESFIAALVLWLLVHHRRPKMATHSFSLPKVRLPD